jgi:hypothetical protein
MLFREVEGCREVFRHEPDFEGFRRHCEIQFVEYGDSRKIEGRKMRD